MDQCNKLSKTEHATKGRITNFKGNLQIHLHKSLTKLIDEESGEDTNCVSDLAKDIQMWA
jgi:hypothetical protein